MPTRIFPPIVTKIKAFGKKSPYEAGIVAIDVYFRNDNDKPIRLNLDTIELVISQPDEARQRLGPLSPEDVADRTILEPMQSENPATSVISHRGSNSGKGKDWNEMVAAFDPSRLERMFCRPMRLPTGFSSSI